MTDKTEDRKFYANIVVSGKPGNTKRIVTSALENANFWVSPRREGKSMVFYGIGSEFKVDTETSVERNELFRGKKYIYPASQSVTLILKAEDDQAAVEAYSSIMPYISSRIKSDRLGIRTHLNNLLFNLD
ncbi:hypothetical protein K8R33_02275 [archaeon]|nr:hypothetical protein [archaeon]